VSASVAGMNTALGLVYLMIGGIILYDLIRNWSTLGFSHFGVAFIFMAFTCGPHHLFHGIHVGIENHPAATLDLITVAVGLPAGAVWVALRLEVLNGGRGDRFIHGTPGWLMAVPTAAGIYVTAVVAAAIAAVWTMLSPSSGVIAGIMLSGLYAAIAYYLVRTQIGNRRPLGGWSLSGLALAGIFGTCAVMHGTYAFFQLNGLYPEDTHMLLIDWIGVPAAMYFLWVVHALFRGDFRDWNGAPGVTKSDTGHDPDPPGRAPVSAPTAPSGLTAVAAPEPGLDARTSTLP